MPFLGYVVLDSTALNPPQSRQNKRPLRVAPYGEHLRVSWTNSWSDEATCFLSLPSPTHSH